MKKLVSVFATIISLATLMSVKPALAQQYGQYGQYGQPMPSQQILVEKLVSAPGTTKGGQVNFVNPFFFFEEISSRRRDNLNIKLHT